MKVTESDLDLLIEILKGDHYAEVLLLKQNKELLELLLPRFIGRVEYGIG